MPLYDKKIQIFYSILDTLFSIVRLFQKTVFKKTHIFEKKFRKLLVLGNGPSLIPTLETNQDKLSQYDIVAVNFMGSTPLFTKYKPNIYVVADPAFWFAVESNETKEKVRNLYDSIASSTTWEITFYLPHTAHKQKLIEQSLSRNPLINVKYYNTTKFEGFDFLSRWVYRKQWGMPRTQNVLNAALMLGIYFQYFQIVIAGADNDWISNLWVDENNDVRISDTHFYNYEEAKKNAKYIDVTMEDSLLSLYFAFHSYKEIATFASKMGIEIINASPNSYIDTFKKKHLW